MPDERNESQEQQGSKKVDTSGGNYGFIKLCYGVVGAKMDTSKMTVDQVVEAFLRMQSVSSPKEYFDKKKEQTYAKQREEVLSKNQTGHTENNDTNVQMPPNATPEEIKQYKEAISKIETKGYRVVATENRWLGKLDENDPVVYDIYKPDNTIVYGSNGTSARGLMHWANSLQEAKKKTPPQEIKNAKSYDEAKAKYFDWLYNEGGEGYNPYRQ